MGAPEAKIIGVDCFPCAVAKRAAEMRLSDAGVDAAEIVARVSTVVCVMCAEADRQEARRSKPSP